MGRADEAFRPASLRVAEERDKLVCAKRARKEQALRAPSQCVSDPIHLLQPDAFDCSSHTLRGPTTFFSKAAPGCLHRQGTANTAVFMGPSRGNNGPRWSGHPLSTTRTSAPRAPALLLRNPYGALTGAGKTPGPPRRELALSRSLGHPPPGAPVAPHAETRSSGHPPPGATAAPA